VSTVLDSVPAYNIGPCPTHRLVAEYGAASYHFIVHSVDRPLLYNTDRFFPHRPPFLNLGSMEVSP